MGKGVEDEGGQETGGRRSGKLAGKCDSLATLKLEVSSLHHTLEQTVHLPGDWRGLPVCYCAQLSGASSVHFTEGTLSFLKLRLPAQGHCRVLGLSLLSTQREGGAGEAHSRSLQWSSWGKVPWGWGGGFGDLCPSQAEHIRWAGPSLLCTVGCWRRAPFRVGGGVGPAVQPHTGPRFPA